MKRTIQVTIYVLFAAVLTSCGGNTPKSEETTAVKETAGVNHEDENTVEFTSAQYKTAGIALGSPEMKDLSGLLKVNGFIDVPPQNLVSVTTQMGGIVKSTPLLQGSTVSKGQVIAVLQNQEYVLLQQDYLESKSQLELADSEYKRQQTLAEQNVNAKKTLQQARAQFQSMLARESALKQRLQLININPASLSAANIRSQINIYSPITGYVTKVNVNTGKFVNPNDAMFEIVNSANLHVELNVFERDASKVKAGQRVRFSMANDTEEQIAVVDLVGREINSDKTITVHAISKGSTSFIPGAYLKAYIETGTSKVQALPNSAVVDFGGKKYIFVSEGSEKQGMYYFKMVEVSIGVNDGGYLEVQIPEGVAVNGKVVLKGTYDLLSKLKNSEEAGHGH
ncbi:efflux RND transporter periplasmic adaptor subunit [Pedobacter panaciterrae]|uniref:efflux RND transporter periplasmic adaptor subunit n=1 Tax=Pedobacter panaciterrae TaxID=363849 RepID=UPI00155DBD1E|nr:efflux RND transporter periplasmic adaptor subunit [Pedobacter panaciterrae]NQX53921.1 efflux RND transporter periplasmic adaptor subunit [Pedobacter panaciterrae]